jgi:hypothetical protein
VILAGVPTLIKIYGGAVMQVKKFEWFIRHEGDTYRIVLEFSEFIYADAYPYLSLRYGDENYRRSGLIGQPWVYDLIAVKISFNNKTYFLVIEENFWSDYSDTESVFDFELDNIKARLFVNSKDSCYFSIMTEAEFDKYLEEIENYN